MGGRFLAASKVFRRASKFTKFCRFAGKGFLVLAVTPYRRAARGYRLKATPMVSTA